ncbi:MAG TPA: serine/threonine-protein kinase, partial [Planctomycetota bacterium]|nr:serine/threonine-protein kinase [Planctomycetota bacterium]
SCGARLEVGDAPDASSELVPYHSTRTFSIPSDAFDPAVAAPPARPSSDPPSVRAAADDDKPDPFVGKVLGGCKIHERIAAGGMGVIYRATQLNLGRTVAVKILSRELSSDEAFVRRFIEEARSAAQLSHGNIVHINDVGDYHGIFYFTMEYVDGIDLKTLLKERKLLPIPLSLEITTQVARALEHAHGRGIIHRDIKPENIMITRDGAVKLADLGLAKKLSTGGADGLTQAGSVLGTPYYMAPEQARDFRAVDERSDLYSLGVTLYKMITGAVPFRGRSPIEVMVRVLDGKRPSVSELREDVPPQVEAIVDRMMDPDPSRRYENAGALLRDLESVRRGLDSSSSRGRRKASDDVEHGVEASMMGEAQEEHEGEPVEEHQG